MSSHDIISASKAVIFDMDGVLVDSEPFWKQAEFQVFSSLGVPVLDEYSALTRAMTTREATQFWFEKYPWKNKHFDEVEQMAVSIVIRLIEQEDCSIGGVREFIQNLKYQKVKIGLATNSPASVVPVVLKKTGLQHFFDVCISAENEEKGKPDPGVYYTAAEKLGVHPAECVAIEDSRSGMEAAKRAGMNVIAFTNGGKNQTFGLADDVIADFRSEIDFFDLQKTED